MQGLWSRSFRMRRMVLALPCNEQASSDRAPGVTLPHSDPLDGFRCRNDFVTFK